MEKLRKFETEEQFFNEIETYPQVSLTQDNGKVWVSYHSCNLMITDGLHFSQYYEVKKGITWEELLSTNTIRFYDENGPTLIIDENDMVVWDTNKYFFNDIGNDLKENTINKTDMVDCLKLYTCVQNSSIGEFEIDGFNYPPFEFLIGMTWEEFINSNYNNYNFNIENDEVYLRRNPITISMDDSTPIMKTDLIINGYIYGSIPV